MDDVPPAPSKSRGRKIRTPVPVKNLELVPDKETTPLPPLPGLNELSAHNHTLALPVIHGAVSGGGGAARPTLLERRNRTGMSMSCLSGLSMDTIHETSRDHGAHQITSEQVPSATFRGWSNDTADAALVEPQTAAVTEASGANSTTTIPVANLSGTRRSTASALSVGVPAASSTTMTADQEKKRSPSGFSIVSYNILAARLVTTDRYPDCPPAALGEDYRLKLIREELAVANADLIALQEISVDVFEKEDGLGAFLHQERDYDGEFVVITSKAGADRCEVRRQSHEEKAVSTKSTPHAAEAGVRLCSRLLPVLPVSRRESRTGSCGTANTTNSDEPIPNVGTPVHCERSGTAPEQSRNTAFTAPPLRRLSATGCSPLTRKPVPLTSVARGGPLNPPAPQVETVASTGSSGGCASAAASSLQLQGSPPQPSRRTEMDGLAIFWKKSRFELVETIRIRFNELAAADANLSPFERKKLQVDSHNVGLVCVLRDVMNPATIVIVSTVHLIWQRVEAQLWQANELIKVVERLKAKYERSSDASPRESGSPYTGSHIQSRCSQSMPVTLSAPASQPLLCRRKADHVTLRQSDSNFGSRRETNSASFTRICTGASCESPTAQSAPRVTCLLAGDFNAEPTHPVVSFLTSGHVPARAETVGYWRKRRGDAVTPTDPSEEEEEGGPTISSVAPILDGQVSFGALTANDADNQRATNAAATSLPWPPDHSASVSPPLAHSLAAPPPPCKNWSRKRTANPIQALSSGVPTVTDTTLATTCSTSTSVKVAAKTVALGPVTPPRDGRGEAYRGRRLDTDVVAASGMASETHAAQDAAGHRDRDDTALTTRALPLFEDFHDSSPAGAQGEAVDSSLFADQPEGSNSYTSKALSELSAGPDLNHPLFVPGLMTDRNGIGGSSTTTSAKTANASPLMTPSPPVAVRRTRGVTDSGKHMISSDGDGDGPAPRHVTSIDSSPQQLDADGWPSEVNSANGEKDLLNMSPIVAPFRLPQSKRWSTRVPLPRASRSPSGTDALNQDTAPTHTLRFKDAYAQYRAHNPRLVSAVNPSTNAEGKVLDHIFYFSDQFVCQSVLKLGELVELPNAFFPSDHYMIGAAFVPGPRP